MIQRAYHSPPDIAKQLGINDTKVLTWIRNGELIAIDISTVRGGRPRWRIRHEDLEAFLQKRRTTKPVSARRRQKAATSGPNYF
jgi:excisionase family DNA binding protein